MASIKYWLDNFHFLRLTEGRLVFWNYRTHEQFEITMEHLARMQEYSMGSIYDASAIDQELLESRAIGKEPKTSEWKWDWLAHIFHFGTNHPFVPEEKTVEQQTNQYSQSYAEHCKFISDKAPPVDLIKGGRSISLPVPDTDCFDGVSLWEALSKRRTCRDFDGSAVSLNDLSDLLFATFGDQNAPDLTLPENVRVYGYRRTAPSAGGLQCTEPYIWVINVSGIEPGIYHYLSRSHKLEVVNTSPLPYPIGTYLCNQYWANDLAFAVLMTCRLDKMWWKYTHSRAYRPMLMDVGHLSQSLNLCITAKGLYPWITGYFHDKEIAEILQCDEEMEHPILLVGAGHGTGSSLDRGIRREFERQKK